MRQFYTAQAEALYKLVLEADPNNTMPCICWASLRASVTLNPRSALAHSNMSDVPFPLFDTLPFTRDIEAAYTLMWRRSRRGEPPQRFAVDPA